MPRSLDPNSTLTIVLAADVDKDPLPKLFAKSPTVNMQRKIVGLLASLQGDDLAAKFDAIMDAAAACFTGWENIPFEFSKANIGEVYSLDEIVEVFGFLVAGTTVDDKKKSESQPS